VTALRKRKPRLKGDEPILGDSDFVLDVLEAADDQLSRRYRLHPGGYDHEELAEKLARVCEISPQEIYPGFFAWSERALFHAGFRDGLKYTLLFDGFRFSTLFQALSIVSRRFMKFAG
jgi:hypothetical protein